MEPLRSEEDQIRALKQWWDENGSSTLIGIGLALMIVFGWQWWQQRELRLASESAALYQQLAESAQLAAKDEAQRKTAEHLAQQLKDGQSGRRLGDYGSLMLARLMVERQDLAGAEKELRELVSRQSDEPVGKIEDRVNRIIGRYRDAQVGALARLRLARVLFAMDRGDEALALLDASRSGYFGAEKAIVRGDILRAKGDFAGARAAYADAVAKSGGKPSGLLELKMQEVAALAPADAAGAAPSAALPSNEVKP